MFNSFKRIFNKISNKQESVEKQNCADSETVGNIISLWSKYEDIAMHFNELILKIRTYAIGGLATAATICIGIAQATSNSLERWITFQLIFACLSTIWLAIWIIDRAYYSKLLQGSVDEIIRLENEITTNQILPIKLLLSSTIHTKLRSSSIPNSPHVFYGLPFFILLIGFAFSYFLSLNYGVNHTDQELIFVNIQKGDRKANSKEIGLYLFNKHPTLEINEVIVEVESNVLPKNYKHNSTQRTQYRVSTKLAPLSKSQMIIIDQNSSITGDFNIKPISYKTSPYVDEITKKHDAIKTPTLPPK
jgi:hypothetical protein